MCLHRAQAAAGARAAEVEVRALGAARADAEGRARATDARLAALGGRLEAVEAAAAGHAAHAVGGCLALSGEGRER